MNQYGEEIDQKLEQLKQWARSGDTDIVVLMAEAIQRDVRSHLIPANGNVPTPQPITVSRPVATKSSRGRPGVKTRAWLRIVKDAGPDGITNPEIRAKLMAEGFTIDPNWLSGQPSKWRNKGENIESYEGKYRWVAP